MFCRNCGKELIGTPEFCVGCGAKPLAGNKFCQACSAPTDPMAAVCLKCGAGLGQSKSISGDVSPKSRLITTLLAFFLGHFGAHRFYLGKIGTAVTMLVLAIVGYVTMFIVVGFFFLAAVGIWSLIDFIMAIAGTIKDKDGKVVKNWES
jgi:TM2 domain-containing membrane protein YozV